MTRHTLLLIRPVECLTFLALEQGVDWGGLVLVLFTFNCRSFKSLYFFVLYRDLGHNNLTKIKKNSFQNYTRLVRL